MSLAYRLSTSVYFSVVKIAALFNHKANKMIKGRKDFDHNLEKVLDKNTKYIWVHCASLGEFEQGRALIEKINLEFIPDNPNYKILLSFFSPSGYEQQKEYAMVDKVIYLPFDTPKNAKKFVEILNPAVAIFVKYEIWYYTLKELKLNNVPTFLIAATFRKNQIFFKTIGKSYLQALSFFSEIFLQNEESKVLLSKYNIHNTLVCGDTRVDRVMQIASQDYNNEFLKKFSEDHYTIVCGSTWLPDEKILTQFINNSSSSHRLIVAPHEIHENHLKQIESLLKVKYVRLSKCVEITDDLKVIIVDSIGILSKIYRYGKLAYIGGGFGVGIHNVLEAVVYKIPVIFGPNYAKFIEANDLIARKVAFSIKNKEEFDNIIQDLSGDNKEMQAIDRQIQDYLEASSGATQIIFDKIFAKK